MPPEDGEPIARRHAAEIREERLEEEHPRRLKPIFLELSGFHMVQLKSRQDRPLFTRFGKNRHAIAILNSYIHRAIGQKVVGVFQNNRLSWVADRISLSPTRVLSLACGMLVNSFEIGSHRSRA